MENSVREYLVKDMDKIVRNMGDIKLSEIQGANSPEEQAMTMREYAESLAQILELDLDYDNSGEWRFNLIATIMYMFIFDREIENEGGLSSRNASVATMIIKFCRDYEKRILPLRYFMALSVKDYIAYLYEALKGRPNRTLGLFWASYEIATGGDKRLMMMSETITIGEIVQLALKNMISASENKGEVEYEKRKSASVHMIFDLFIKPYRLM